MRQAVETQIDINASAETVWALIDDSTNWDRWSEIFVGLDGPRHVGGRMKLRLRLGGLLLGVGVTLVEFDGRSKILWTGGLPGILMGSHGYHLEPLESGGVRFVHYERFSGIANVFAALAVPTMTRDYNQLNRELKAAAEAV